MSVSDIVKPQLPPGKLFINGRWEDSAEGRTIDIYNPVYGGVADPMIKSQSADIIFQVAGGCGLGALKSAGTAGVYSIGVDADQKDADASVIASALKRVDVATYDAIKGVKDGTFQGGALTFSLQNDGVGYQADNLQLPSDVMTAVQDVSAKIKSGALTPPADIPDPTVP